MRRYGWRGCALAVLLAAPRAALAQALDTLRLADALAAAVAGNPMLAAARLRADAAAQRVGPAGALPDPQLTLGLMNRPLGDLGSTAEPMTMNQVQLSQMLPWPGKLGGTQRRARHLADAALLDAEEARLVLLARVRSVYARAAFMDRALAVMEETRGLLRDFLNVSQTMYAVGTGLQQDVLQAQVAVARMTEDIEVMRAERAAMGARLNALMGREASAALGSLELPAPGTPPPDADTLMARAVAARPALRAAAERVRAADAGYSAARRELYPDFMIGLAYSERPQFDDMVTLMVGVSIPLWAGRKQLPMRREMAAERAMSEAEERDLYYDTHAEIVRLQAEAARARRLAELYAAAVLPQARAAVASALSAYRVGRVDYMTLVESQMTVNRYEIERLRLTADYQAAIAELDALVGSEPGGLP